MVNDGGLGLPYAKAKNAETCEDKCFFVHFLLCFFWFDKTLMKRFMGQKYIDKPT